MLPAIDSDLNYEGQFYIGYEAYNSSVLVVVASLQAPYNKFELMLNLSRQDLEGELVLPLVGLVSPYYYYYFRFN